LLDVVGLVLVRTTRQEEVTTNLSLDPLNLLAMTLGDQVDGGYVLVALDPETGQGNGTGLPERIRDRAVASI